MERWQKIALWSGAALLGYVWGVPAVIDFVGRGRRLTETELDDNLSIPESPEELAERASAVVGRYVDPVAYGLARMVRSEEPNANDTTKTYLVHVARNDASRSFGGDILRALTFSSVASRNGLFGKQTSRRYSTRSDPYERDLVIAEAALEMSDTTNGARKFYHKQLTEIAGVRSFDEIVERWGREGLEPFDLPGTPIGLVFFA
ncbi:MAG TPA: hypothetical protein VEB22_11270 [Phycisphaerales bacterium]|nr:hypothetical protein [Phycisphaerales bacterium]